MEHLAIPAARIDFVDRRAVLRIVRRIVKRPEAFGEHFARFLDADLEGNRLRNLQRVRQGRAILLSIRLHRLRAIHDRLGRQVEGVAIVSLRHIGDEHDDPGAGAVRLSVWPDLVEPPLCPILLRGLAHHRPHLRIRLHRHSCEIRISRGIDDFRCECRAGRNGHWERIPLARASARFLAPFHIDKVIRPVRALRIGTVIPIITPNLALPVLSPPAVHRTVELKKRLQFRTFITHDGRGHANPTTDIRQRICPFLQRPFFHSARRSIDNLHPIHRNAATRPSNCSICYGNRPRRRHLTLTCRVNRHRYG